MKLGIVTRLNGPGFDDHLILGGSFHNHLEALLWSSSDMAEPSPLPVVFGLEL